ncbi:MAG: hypothetical protein DMG62_22765 [Acidobacteria bacterium]|nr:MAG: hypothetical protein DMG62_22765 [Acidobacteriota bacterium]
MGSCSFAAGTNQPADGIGHKVDRILPWFILTALVQMKENSTEAEQIAAHIRNILPGTAGIPHVTAVGNGAALPRSKGFSIPGVIHQDGELAYMIFF